MLLLDFRSKLHKNEVKASRQAGKEDEHFVLKFQEFKNKKSLKTSKWPTSSPLLALSRVFVFRTDGVTDLRTPCVKIMTTYSAVGGLVGQKLLHILFVFSFTDTLQHITFLMSQWWLNFTEFCLRVRSLIHEADPLSRPVVIIICARGVRTSVLSYDFSKSRKTKRISSENIDSYWMDCVSGRGDHWCLVGSIFCWAIWDKKFLKRDAFISILAESFSRITRAIKHSEFSMKNLQNSRHFKFQTNKK